MPKAPPAWLAPAAIALLAAAAAADVFRIGFFADDFHFLDVARRVPLLGSLGGAFGVYPWYRPLSRELYFELVVAAGPAAILAAHALSLACAGGCAWLVHRLAGPIAGARAAAIAPALFLTYGFTRFLTAWPSGFQDLLALLLTLLALEALSRERHGRAALWAGLAPFAKETGFAAFPLMLMYAVLVRGERRPRRWMMVQAGVLLAALAVHAGVRATWKAGGTADVIERSIPALAAALGRVLGGFVGRAPVWEGPAVLFAIVAASSVAWLVWSERNNRAAVPRAAPATGFLACAALLGATPLILGQLLGLTSPHAYYAFPAAPWIAMLVARGIGRLSAPAATVLVTALVGWNALALGYREPARSNPHVWRFQRWDWPEAVRLSAVSRWLGEDVRRELADRPDSLVVLYILPEGSYFQTEDGPATREALQDPTVRAFWFNQAPWRIEPGRFTILSFDSLAGRLEHDPSSPQVMSAYSATAVAAGRARSAWAFASTGDSAVRGGFERRYFRAAAALITEGPAAYARQLAEEGLADTLGDAPRRLAFAVIPERPGMRVALERVLAHPREAAAHAALADSMFASGVRLTPAVELRIATALAPSRFGDRLRLALALADLAQIEPARADLLQLAADARGTPAADLARRQLERLAAAPAGTGAR